MLRGANDLHRAARDGSVKVVLGLLAFGAISIDQGSIKMEGSIDIDQGDPGGFTPLMWASYKNHPDVVRILLSKGANLSITTDEGFSALHLAVQQGHLAVIDLLLEAGANVTSTTAVDGCSLLHLAAGAGHLQVATALIQAGANVNHRALDGATPLYAAAWTGRVECVRVLLRANADPTLCRVQPLGRRFTPLDAAAQNGHPDVARELIPPLGSGEIGGSASAGVIALRLAAQHGHVNVMAVLTDAGVVDTGSALAFAAGFGSVATVSYLLRQEQESPQLRGGLYANSRDHLDRPALVLCIGNCRPCSPRIARLLVDAGADSTSPVPIKTPTGSVLFLHTPLAFVVNHLACKQIQGKDATEGQLHALEAIRRLLLQVEAVHAVSWLWPNHAAAIAGTTDGSRRGSTASTVGSPLSRVLPTLRLSATGQRVRWAALVRWVV